MRMLKIEGEGLVTSFRYPFFVAGRQPTFEMPPPATIYGHICSALGDLVDPRGLRFGYCFTHEARATDLEHMHAISHGTGAPGWKKQNIAANLDATVQPLRREFLFQPRLVLYLNRPDWLKAFIRPHYAVVLGRSQDLFTYTRITLVDLVEEPRAYVEHTLLPGALGEQVQSGVAISLPRFLDYGQERNPTFGQYVMVAGRLRPEQVSTVASFLVDPETQLIDGCRRAVILHTFVDE